jgi:hypothetical protein
MTMLLHSCCPKSVQISGLGTGTRLSYEQTLQTAGSETNIQSGLFYYKVGTSGSTLKSYIILAGL